MTKTGRNFPDGAGPVAAVAAAARGRTEGGVNAPVLLVAATALLALVWRAAEEGNGRLGLAAAIGAAAGLALYHASFGFTAAWRRMAREGRGAGLRAQMLLIGLTCLFTYPLMQWGGLIGFPSTGNVLPLGLASALGAFVFGIGMQLGGGCASGTLFVLGGGSVRMVIVLVFFIAGSVWATADWDFWTSLPHTRSGYSIPDRLGTLPGLAVTLSLLAAIAAATVAVERRRHGRLEPVRRTGSWLAGPWSLVAGAVALAAVGVATMAVTGRPWSVTQAFALWGAKLAAAAGIPVDSSYWTPGWRQAQLGRSVFADVTSVMDFGIVLGAMAAAALAGRFRPSLRLSARDIATAVIGGLMMGYGARLAYGCNIGAFLGGMVSGSLHGWWWLLWGFLGSLIGTALRSRIGMDPAPASEAAAPA